MGSVLIIVSSLLLLFLICSVSVSAEFTVGVRVLRYRNRMRSAIGPCDDSSEDACGYYFTFCLQLGGADGTTPTPQSCPLGQQQTEIALSRDVSEAVFGTTGFLGLQNPFFFTGASWPGLARLLVQVDPGEGGSNNIVDRLLVELEAPLGILSVEPTVFIGEDQNIELQLEINVMSNITGVTVTETPTFGVEGGAGGLVAGVIVAVTLLVGISISLIVALALLFRKITVKSISGEQNGSHQKGLTIGDNPTYGDSPLQVSNNHNPDSSAVTVTAEPDAIECSYHRYECVSADSDVDTATTNTSNGELQRTEEDPPSFPSSRNELDGSHSYEYIAIPRTVKNADRDAAEAPANRNGMYWYVSKQQVNLGRVQPNPPAHYETYTT